MRIKLIITLLLLSKIICGQDGYVQEGKASFYADKFEGRTTASGEKYSHAKSTCAHLVLPFGTLVKVTNLSNNQSVVVRVNDRGPFVPDRIIDLSQSASEKLGFKSDGTAQVRIEMLDEQGNVVEPSTVVANPIEKNEVANPKPIPFQEAASSPQVIVQSDQKPLSKPKPPVKPVVVSEPKGQFQSLAPAAQSNIQDYELYELKVAQQNKGGFTVQVGSYKELVNVLRIADDMKQSLKKEVRVQVATVNGEKIYRLMAGEFSLRSDAEAFKQKAAEIYPDCFVVELR